MVLFYCQNQISMLSGNYIVVEGTVMPCITYVKDLVLQRYFIIHPEYEDYC